jgi:hypothetical protein
MICAKVIAMLVVQKSSSLLTPLLVQENDTGPGTLVATSSCRQHTIMDRSFYFALFICLIVGAT